MKKVTLDDVARVAGVSRAAASRALNGKPGVRDDVRERVLGIADHLGFRANRAARNLASGRSSIIGIVFPIRRLSLQPFCAAVLEHVAAEANRRDLGVMMHLTAEEPGDTVLDFVQDGLLDGVLIGTSAIGTWADVLFDSSVPTVLVGTHPTRTDIASVDVENRHSTSRLVTHLFDQGAERVGCITGRPGNAATRVRLEGFEMAHRRAGRPLDRSLIVDGDFSRRSAVTSMATLLDRGVDAVFAMNDEMAVGAMWEAVRLGVHVPGELLVAGFDGVAASDYSERSITSVAQPFELIARSSLDLLDRMIDGGEAEHIVLPAELVLGVSSSVPVATGSG